MIPDAIIVFSAGVMPLPGGGWRSTTYDESDGFGTMGGRDRVEAGALLAERYSEAYIVTNCRRMNGVLPTLAQVYADELEAGGVAPERLLKEEISTNTGTSVTQALLLAKERGWKHLLFLSSEFQIPRITAFYAEEKSTITATTVSSESILKEKNPTFAKTFEKVKQSPAYQSRLSAEARGIEAIKNGTYRPASLEDKRERAV